MMNILYILHTVGVIEGSAKSFMTLLDGLVGRGVTPHVITPGEQGIYKVLQKKGIHVKSLNYRSGVYPNFYSIKDKLLFIPRLVGRRFLEYKAVRDIVIYCRRNDIQLIHTNVSVLSCGLSAAKRLQIPHILHVREYADLDFGLHYYPSAKAFYRKVNAENSYTICITKGIQQYHHFDMSRSRVIYNGVIVNASLDSSFVHDKEDHFFLFAGRIELSKGVIQVVEAFDQYCQVSVEKNVTLKIAGEITDRAYYDYILSYVREKGLQTRIEILGVQRNIDVLMRHAIALIVSSPFEAFGRCIPEAMLNHCLTIGRDTAGTKEQYDNGLALCGKEIGLRYNTTQELAAHMRDVASSPSSMVYAEMKENASQVVKQLYGKETYVAGVISFYQEILSK